MEFIIDISGIALKDCIDSVTCRVDTPNDSDARSNIVSNLIEISGRVGTVEKTIDLYNWSLLPSSDSKAYRNVKVTVIESNAIPKRVLEFPDAFVVDYYESYSRSSGEGTFNLYLKQKKDKNSSVKVSGEVI